MELSKIKTETTWNDAAERINHNNLKISTEISKLQNATYKNKGYFSAEMFLLEAYPTASAGSIAYVGLSYPYTIYVWDEISKEWINTNQTGGDESVDLGNYYTKEETQEVVEEFHVFLSQESYDALETKEDKLYFCYEE